MSNLTIEQIAKVCHEANKTYCEQINDFSQVSWPDSPEWQKISAIAGVNFVINNPTAPLSSNHESWYNQKYQEGWVYGPVKNPETKEHPCMVDYKDLPIEQQRKDQLFRNIVVALMPQYY